MNQEVATEEFSRLIPFDLVILLFFVRDLFAFGAYPEIDGIRRYSLNRRPPEDALERTNPMPVVSTSLGI